MSGQTGSVIFTCSKDGAANIVKKFNLTKLKSGADGQDAVYYDLSSNNTVLKLDINKNFVPSFIIFSSTKRIGDLYLHPLTPEDTRYMNQQMVHLLHLNILLVQMKVLKLIPHLQIQ